MIGFVWGGGVGMGCVLCCGVLCWFFLLGRGLVDLGGWPPHGVYDRNDTTRHETGIRGIYRSNTHTHASI